jgi:hypothetical protein
MRHALRLGFWDLRVYSDSMLVVRQFEGEWKVRDKHLKRLHAEAMILRRLFRTFSIEHVRREKNAEADALCSTMTFEEPSLPPLPVSSTSRKSKLLHEWQAAAIRVWWLRESPGAGVLSRIFGISHAAIEAIGYGKAYRLADFSTYPWTPAPETCPDCKGTGRDNVPYGDRCETCAACRAGNGTGTCVCPYPEEAKLFNPDPAAPCWLCGGAEGLPREAGSAMCKPCGRLADLI